MEVRATWLKKVFPVLVVIVLMLIVASLVLLKPKADKRRANSGPVINVEVFDIEPSSLTPKVLSYGLVEPRTRTTLVSQVGGRIMTLSERFRDGGFFQQGESLLQIDPTDYEIELEIAESSLAQAEQGLAEEIAQVEQAKADWNRLGNSESVSSLVLREPQLRAARAGVNSAKALLKQAKINLERTSVKAPYSGRVLSTNVDLGQVVSNNTELGEIYATDAVEIRLPVKNEDLPLLSLPEYYRDQEQTPQNFPAVSIRSELAKEEVWQGLIVRTAGSIDDNSRQLNVVAQIDDPFGRKAQGRFPLKIGQYVTAEIDGINIDAAIVIPNKAVYQGSYVYLYREGAVHRTPIQISWQNGDQAVISEGVKHGDRLVVSPLGQVTSGTLVKLIPNAASKNEVPLVEQSAEADDKPENSERDDVDPGASSFQRTDASQSEVSQKQGASS